MKKSVVMVIAHRDFRDEELKIPYDYLTQQGYAVLVASTDTTEAVGMVGMTCKPDLALRTVDPAGLDALVLVGGSGSRVLWDDTTVRRLVRYCADHDKLVAAICLAPVTLARAGLLAGKKATCFPSAADELVKAGAQCTGGRVERSGTIITASGPEAAPDFARAIADYLR